MSHTEVMMLQERTGSYQKGPASWQWSGCWSDWSQWIKCSQWYPVHWTSPLPLGQLGEEVCRQWRDHQNSTTRLFVWKELLCICEVNTSPHAATSLPIAGPNPKPKYPNLNPSSNLNLLSEKPIGLWPFKQSKKLRLNRWKIQHEIWGTILKVLNIPSPTDCFLHSILLATNSAQQWKVYGPWLDRNGR